MRIRNRGGVARPGAADLDEDGTHDAKLMTALDSSNRSKQATRRPARAGNFLNVCETNY
jgi:hypothetical protein